MSLFNIFKQDREELKEKTISYCFSEIVNNLNQYNHIEQTEILNRLTLRLLERKKEERDKLIREAREVQEALKDIKIL